MPKTHIDELAARIVALEQKVDANSRDRLNHASLDGSTLWLKDPDGNIRGRVGSQGDGSIGSTVVSSPPQPQLTAPIVTAGSRSGSAKVKWDGETFDGRKVPLVHGHTEVWAELLADGAEPTVAPLNQPQSRAGTIRDRKGGEVTITAPQAGVWAVWLRMVGQDRETVGPWSPVTTFEVVPLVNVVDLDQRIQDFTDGELDDAAYDNLMARLGEFLHIRAGSLASNEIEAMHIVSSLIESTVIEGRDGDGELTYRLDGMDNYILGEVNAFATPEHRDEVLGSSVAEGTTCSTISPSMQWRRENGEWVPMPGAWKLASVDFSGQPTDNPAPLNIPTGLQGYFSRYEVIVKAGVVEGGSGLVRAIMVLPNGEYGSGFEHYRWIARAERSDGTSALSSSVVSGTHPNTGYVGAFEGHISANFAPADYGDTGYMTWETTGWANIGTSAGGRLVRSGGRWNRPTSVPITHFGVRPVNGAGNTWHSSAQAELWGYR